MKFYILGFLFLAPYSLGATPLVEIEDQLKNYSEVLESSTMTGGKELILTSIRVRSILEFSITIPTISKASLNPEIDLHFTKSQ
jgi:hypothetical protein